jgi:GST-like protein
LELIGSLGCGSMIVELALALAGLPCRLTDVPYLKDGPERARLLALNPLGQVPTLVLDDGTVMTESAAILLYLDGLAPRAGLIPPVGAPGRAGFLNRLILLVAAIYPTFTYGDEPERWTGPGISAETLRARTDAKREALLVAWEAVAGPGPFASGAAVSALDLYLLPMSYWRPRRAWFAAHAPTLLAFADTAGAHPALAPVLARHLPAWQTSAS